MVRWQTNINVTDYRKLFWRNVSGTFDGGDVDADVSAGCSAGPHGEVIGDVIS